MGGPNASPTPVAPAFYAALSGILDWLFLLLGSLAHHAV